MEADRGSWYSPLLRSASLLTGDIAQAERLAASAVRSRGDTPDAYFTLYRRFLSPLRRWSRPSWAGSLSRREVAIVVAGVHDGWPEEDVADLVDRRPERVREVLGEQPFSAETLRDLTGSPDSSRLTTRIIAAERRSRVYVAAAIVATAVGLGGGLALSPGDEPARTWPTPTPAYTPPAVADLPRTLKSALTMGYPLADFYGEYESSGLWHVVDTEGARWFVSDASPRDGDLYISPDGRKIVYESLKKHGPVVADLTTGKVVPISGPSDAVTAFSLDGRQLARWIEDADAEDLQVMIIDLDQPKSPTTYRDARFGGWTRKGAVLISEEETRLARPDGSTVRISSFSARDSARVSADGKLAAEPNFSDRIAIVDLPSGETLREIAPPKGTHVDLHRWVTPTSILVGLREGRKGPESAHPHLLDTRTGTFTPLEADIWSEVPWAFGLLQPLK